jgi:hypothetical protein
MSRTVLMQSTGQITAIRQKASNDNMQETRQLTEDEVLD